MIDGETWAILAERLAEIRRERERLAAEPEPLETLVFDQFDRATVATLRSGSVT